MDKRWRIPAWVLVLACGGVARAQEPIRFGGEGVTFWTRPAFANPDLPGDQDYPRVAIDGEGRILVVWNDDRYGHGESPECYDCYGEVAGQVYDRAGFPIGRDFILNSQLPNPQWGPAIAVRPRGGFVVVWTDSGDGGEAGEGYGQMLSPEGAFEGENLLVSVGCEWNRCEVWPCDFVGLPDPYPLRWCEPAGIPDLVRVSHGGGDRWVATWWKHGIWYQVFDGAEPRGMSREILEELILSVLNGDVAVGEGGDFKVAGVFLCSRVRLEGYEDYHCGDPPDVLHHGYSRTIFLFEFDADGEFVRMRDLGERVSTDCFSAGPRMARDGRGRFVVVWWGSSDESSEERTSGIFARLFRWEDAEPLGPTFAVHAERWVPGVFTLRTDPEVAMDSAGNFVVVYAVNEAWGAAQRFLADGTPYGHEFNVTDVPGYGSGGWEYHAEPRVAMNDSGRVAIAWSTAGPWDSVVRVYDFWAPDFIRGDVTGEGVVELTDAMAIARYLFVRGSAPPVHPDAADTNDDGEQDIADVVYLLFHLYLGRPKRLPLPYPHWGFDTTEDSLGG
ncbi:MAG: dockerin type I repeat-containing protein [Planctomycetota bacterium]